MFFEVQCNIVYDTHSELRTSYILNLSTANFRLRQSMDLKMGDIAGCHLIVKKTSKMEKQLLFYLTFWECLILRQQ